MADLLIHILKGDRHDHRTGKSVGRDQGPGEDFVRGPGRAESVSSLIDTLDRAKRRAVEPDFLRTTAYAQLLPAVLSTFTSFPFGTISTNLAAQPASMIVTEGP